MRKYRQHSSDAKQNENWKKPGPASLELSAATGEVGIQVIGEICHMDLDGFEVPDKWALSIVVQIL